MWDILISKLLQLLVDWKYVGLFISSLGLFPTEIVIALLASTHKASVLGISFVSALGGLVGSYLAFFLGYLLTEENLYRWIEGNGKFLKIEKEKVEKSKKKILKRSFWYVFFTRFIPWLKIVASIAAGFLKVNIFSYSLAVFLGGFIYAYIIAVIAAQMDSDLESIKRYIHTIDKWLILLTVGYILISITYKNRKKILKEIKRLQKKYF